MRVSPPPPHMLHKRVQRGVVRSSQAAARGLRVVREVEQHHPRRAAALRRHLREVRGSMRAGQRMRTCGRQGTQNETVGPCWSAVLAAAWQAGEGHGAAMPTLFKGNPFLFAQTRLGPLFL